MPGGNSVPLTFNNRKDYVDKVINFRLHEMDKQVCMRKMNSDLFFLYHWKQQAAYEGVLLFSPQLKGGGGEL